MTGSTSESTIALPSDEAVPAPPPTPATPGEPLSSSDTSEDVHPECTLGAISRSTITTARQQVISKEAADIDPPHPPPLSQRFELALYLENSGSVARDHLALERTFLAYVRTSLLFASTGVAFVQLLVMAATDPDTLPIFAKVRRYARPVGATLVAFGMLVLMIGLRRFFLIQRALTKGVFPVTRFAALGIVIILAAIITVIFGVLVSARAR